MLTDPPPPGWNMNPPPYNPSAAPQGYGIPPAAPPSYAEASGAAPYQPITKQPGTVIVTTVVPVGPESTHMICPHCRFEIESSTSRKPGLIAYLSGFVIFLLGCWCGCCLLPCCIDSCMDVHHSCPNCNAYLGRYSR